MALLSYYSKIFCAIHGAGPLVRDGAIRKPMSVEGELR